MNVQALIDLRARLEYALAMARHAEAYLVGGHYDTDTATSVAKVLNIAGSVSAEAIAYLSGEIEIRWGNLPTSSTLKPAQGSDTPNPYCH